MAVAHRGDPLLGIRLIEQGEHIVLHDGQIGGQAGRFPGHLGFRRRSGSAPLQRALGSHDVVDRLVAVVSTGSAGMNQPPARDAGCYHAPSVAASNTPSFSTVRRSTSQITGASEVSSAKKNESATAQTSAKAQRSPSSGSECLRYRSCAGEHAEIGNWHDDQVGEEPERAGHDRAGQQRPEKPGRLCGSTAPRSCRPDIQLPRCTEQHREQQRLLGQAAVVLGRRPEDRKGSPRPRPRR